MWAHAASNNLADNDGLFGALAIFAFQPALFQQGHELLDLHFLERLLEFGERLVAGCCDLLLRHLRS